jgi:scyllo-inositol 2-dehydrogenase (NADP+)
MTRLALVVAVSDPDVAAAVNELAAHLRSCGIAVTTDHPRDADATLVVADRALEPEVTTALLEVARSGRPLLLAGATAASWDGPALTELAGLLPARPTPEHLVRLRPGREAAQLAARWADDVSVSDGFLLIEKVLDDVDVMVTSMSGLTEHPVVTWRASTAVGVCTLGNSPAALRSAQLQRVMHRWIRHALGRRDGADVRVGILGYGAIGHEHSEAIRAVDGLQLTGACDQNPSRLAAARSLVPDLTAYDDGDDLLNADDVDLVIVSTPPNSHADWALRALAAGKHVVVEKPFCLTTAEADEMVAAAAAADLTLAVYQNRRWDADYLALKKLVRSGAIGQVFHYESFVGSYSHPCNYWHSDEEVSGGAIYDWGSHYLDWVLDLMPQPVEHVTAAAHKRVWHDVTNADHSRVTIRFVDGTEAEFVHSDLAAAMKPKWYVLGTAGALVGQWRLERVVARNPIGNLLEDRLAAAESPADLSLHAPDGSVTSVAVPAAPRQPFHRELADHVLSGAAMSVTPAGSRRNIAVMEAASASAREGGRPVAPL